MKFVHPYFLFALFSLAIPVIIHLFNFRRFKRVYFTNVRFLREVRQETQSRNKLKHLLVLLARCLALTFLVLAFAQPFIPLTNQRISTGDKAISIYIDNSFSMDAVNTSNTSLLKEAKDAAAEIVSAYKPTDRFQLLTNDFEGRHQRFVSKQEFLELLDEVKPTPTVRTLSEVTSRQQDLLSNADGIQSQNKFAFLVSDFQESISDFAKIKTDTGIVFRPVQMVAQNRNNVYIDSCWFESPVHRLGHPEKLHVRLRSHSDQALENVPMTLYLNDKIKTPGSFSIEPNGKTDTVINFTVRDAGMQLGRITIKDYPVTFDDNFYFTYEVQQIPVLGIKAAATGLPASADANTASWDRLFAMDSTLTYTSVDENKIDYSSLPSYRFIVLDQLKAISSGLGQELKKFVQNGGSLFIFPGTNIEPQGYSDFLSGLNCNTFGAFDTSRVPVDRISYENSFYQGVFERKAGNIDLPLVKGHYRIGSNIRTTQEVLLQLRNGDAFVCRNTFGKGKVYLCASPLDRSFSNFVDHALFVPIMFQAALLSKPQVKLFYTIGSDEPIELAGASPTGDNVFHITNAKVNFDIIPALSVTETGVSIDVHRQVRDSGNYFIDENSKHLAAVAFNYDRKESDLTVLDAKAISEQIAGAHLTNFSLVETGAKSLAASLKDIDQGRKLWKWCIWLALLFLLAEILLLRLWNTQKTKPAVT